MHHAGIEVSDLERSIQFYHKWLGFTLEKEEVLGGERIAFLKREEQRIELVENRSLRSACSFFHLAFEVKEIEQMVLEMKEQGIEILEPLNVLGNGWKNAFISGPDEEWIELIEFPS